MMVLESHRRMGVAALLLEELEKWARECHFTRMILESGTRQPDANGFYQKHGYVQIPNYEAHQAQTESVCFAKTLVR